MAKDFPSPAATVSNRWTNGKGPMMIKERVGLIAGELTVESNPGQGTSLEVTVPRNGEVPMNFRKSQQVRLVIADDHPIFRDGLRRLLEAEAEMKVHRRSLGRRRSRETRASVEAGHSFARSCHAQASRSGGSPRAQCTCQFHPGSRHSAHGRCRKRPDRRGACNWARVVSS